MEVIDEVVAEFLVESHENLDQLDQDLLALEQDPGSPELLAGVFRTIHTIKGTSGALAFHRLERLTHLGENLLSRLRDGRIALTEARATALLQLVDAVRGLLREVEATGGEGDADHSELIATLSVLLEDGAPRLGTVLVRAGETTPEALERAYMQQRLGDTRPIGSILLELGAATPEAIDGALEAQAQARAAAHRSVLDGSVRVDVELLDSVLGLVDELAQARDELVSRLGAGEHPGDCAHRLSRITDQLQKQVLKTRLQPVDVVWSRMPRVVRHLARTCGRQVRLELEGGETLLDRSVLEAVKDPLTHLVRNAVDHGIERPEDRLRAGKPAEGLLTLRAHEDGGQVHLEVTEDGAGIDPARIAATALERRLLSRGQLANMSSQEVLDLIFLPGFSTAPAVTNVSGRGVGMDVVKNRIEAIGGSVDVSSTVGEGSEFRLTIPVTLPIRPALVAAHPGGAG